MSLRRIFPAVIVLAAWFAATSSAESACVPVVSGNRTGESGTTHADAYDGDPDTRFNSTYSNWQWIQFDMQCAGRLQGARRRMTRGNNDATGARPDHQGEGFSYSADGVTWTNLTSANATGWQAYLNRVPHAWYGLPFGWSAWLRPLSPVQARYVRFNWDDNFDAVNEVELLFVEEAPAPPSYEVVDLGTLLVGGPFPAVANAINKRGVVAGSFTSGGRTRAVLWDLDFVGHTIARELDAGCGPICPSNAAAHDVNDHDEAVGFSQGQAIQGPFAAHWGLRTPRPLPGELTNSTSYGINNEGDVAGTEFEFFAAPASPSYAYRLHWEAARNGVLLDTGTYTRSGASDINDLGDVVGTYRDPASQRNRPYFYRTHRANGLAPQALGLDLGYDSGTASAISNARLIAGAQTTAANVSHATVWRDGPLIWLPTRLDTPAVAGAALGVNDVGHAVGHHGGTTAVLWRDGRAYNLNQLIPAGQQPDWQLREARDINDRGEIVGVGTHLGRATAFLLRPVRPFEIAPLDGAEEINDRGAVAGNLANHTGAWLKAAGAPRPVGMDAAEAADINDSGVVAGWNATIGASLWSLPWSGLDLPAPSGDTRAIGVSSSGHAAGYLNLNNDHGLFWNERNQLSQPLPIPSYLYDVNTSGEAIGKDGVEPTRWSQRLGAQTLDYNGFINDAFEIDSRGFVVGAEGNQGTDAKIWDLAGDRRSLGTLDNGSHFSAARAINDRRQVVGSHSSGNGVVAFLWEQDTMIDLNLLMPPGTPWELTSAHDINDAGQILGTGRIQGESSSTGFVMTLSSEAEAVTQLCRGWCEPIKRCGFETGPFNNEIWSRDDHPRYNGCVNGCVAYAMDPARPHTLEQERQVRDCFLAGGQALCTQQWESRTQACCVNQGLGSCDVYY
jgi:probable HAF family extracellular repeat protein